MQPGFDISDYLEQHGRQVTAQAITNAINSSVEFTENTITGTGTSTIEVISFAEIDAQKFEDKPVIDGLLDEKEHLFIAGNSGAGKSLLLNKMGLDLAHPPVNGKMWGRFSIPNSVKSVFVQSENSAKGQNKRLRMLFQENANIRTGAGHVFIARLEGGDDIRLVGNLAKLEFQEKLCKAINLVDAKVLILDPLISYHEANENDNMEMRKALDCLQIHVLDRTGASAIIAHHFNRQGETRGASAIRDFAANVLLLKVVQKREDGSAVIKVKHDKARNFPQANDFYLERTPGLDFIPIEKPDDKKDKKVDEAVTILARIGGKCESQAVLKKSVMKELNCSETTARRIIKDALDQKKILIDPGDVNKKGVSVGYYLPR